MLYLGYYCYYSVTTFYDTNNI